MTAKSLLVPAKINLHLRVGPVRSDGFHPLLTWMTTIGLFDKLFFSPGTTPGRISMTCSELSLPCDDRNLVVKAAMLLGESTDQSVSIHLEKNIPHGGGLGGGSADAAFTLTALNQFWNLGKTTDQLAELAAKLGSDIPFFLHGPSSICRGRGEIVRPIAFPSRAKWVVLILPTMSMPTPAVYRQFDAMGCGWQADIDHEPDWGSWAELPAEHLLERLFNDLEAPAFVIAPQLDQLRMRIEKSVERPVRMSGSGSSLFTLFDDRAGAQAAAEDIIARCEVRAMAVELAVSNSASPQ